MRRIYASVALAILCAAALLPGAPARADGADAAGSTVADLIAELGLSGRRVAVEINRNVITRDAWPQQRVTESDQVEVVQFVGGG